MPTYLNLHLALENLRNKSEQNKEFGPRVLILGPKDSGKTSICKILLNYSLRQKRRPLFIDLDTMNGTITIPGSIGAVSLDYVLSVEEGFSNLVSISQAEDKPIQPLSYFYGYHNPSENSSLYQRLVNQLGQMIDKRMKKNLDNKVSGCIIDTIGLVDEKAFELHLNAIKTFNVNVVIVVGHERLYSDMVRANQDNKDITVLRLAKSGGVVTRDPETMKELQSNKIREYFYGTVNNELTPSPNVIKFNDINIFKVGESKMAPTSALPVGMDRKLSETKLTKMELGEYLLHSILAVCSTNSDQEDDIITSNIHGFVYITDIDQANQTITLLLPSTGKLPNSTLLLSSFQWFDV
ncbi:Pre-mRNA cleavage complex II Clp1 [Neoconidiobolus thromboides FSU 785]|nr:Pre-mRNA cleavage complex II Clp1 [Neoconidiobolus thromboides FSU 785]